LFLEPLEARQLLSIDLVSGTAAGEIANHASWEPAISADGRYVAFTTHSRNLAPLTRTDERHVLVKDLANGEVINVDAAGCADRDQLDQWPPRRFLLANHTFVRRSLL
jgi:hypothetical protein